MRTSTEGTTAYAANQGIAAVINEHSDELFPEAQTSPGTEANVGALMREEAEMVYLQDWAAYEVTEGIDEYGDLEFQMAQVFHFYDLPWFFCTADDDIETLEDATSETTISPTPEGSGTAPALEYMLENAIGDYDRVSLTYDEQANAMEEGRLDIGVGTYMNFDTEPGWLQEMMSTVDLRILDVADETVEEWENDERLFIESFDGSELEEGESSPNRSPTKSSLKRSLTTSSRERIWSTIWSTTFWRNSTNTASHSTSTTASSGRSRTRNFGSKTRTTTCRFTRRPPTSSRNWVSGRTTSSAPRSRNRVEH